MIKVRLKMRRMKNVVERCIVGVFKFGAPRDHWEKIPQTEILKTAFVSSINGE
jgi:hypothetical protein